MPWEQAPPPHLRGFHGPNKVVVEAQRDHVSRPGAGLWAEPEAGRVGGGAELRATGGCSEEGGGRRRGGRP